MQKHLEVEKSHFQIGMTQQRITWKTCRRAIVRTAAGDILVPCPSALKPSCVACGRYTSIPDYLFPAADMNPVSESIACNQGVSSLERGEAVLLSRVPLCRCILCVFPLSVAWNLVPGRHEASRTPLTHKHSHLVTFWVAFVYFTSLHSHMKIRY